MWWEGVGVWGGVEEGKCGVWCVVQSRLRCEWLSYYSAARHDNKLKALVIHPVAAVAVKYLAHMASIRVLLPVVQAHGKQRLFEHLKRLCITLFLFQNLHDAA